MKAGRTLMPRIGEFLLAQNVEKLRQMRIE
jgi:hypothetical protein